MSGMYSVQSGDTLNALAKRMGVDAEDLMRANGMNPALADGVVTNNKADPDRLVLGQQLVIPAATPGFEQKHTVVSGDTMSEVADRWNVSVADLLRANPQFDASKLGGGMDTSRNGNSGWDPDALRPGDVLSKPGAQTPAPVTSPTAPPASAAPAPAAPRASTGTVRDETSGRSFQTSADGTPKYRQGDSEWGNRALGTGGSMSASGCAVTATAMALSKISGRTITPGELDKFMDRNGGYSGNAINWNAAARMIGGSMSSASWSMSSINRQLDAGRPVVIGVDYKQGSNGGANGTDHWVTVTGRGTENGRAVYYANDPASGKEMKFTLDGNRLVGESGSKTYRSTGELRVISGGGTPAANPPGSASRPAAAAPAAPIAAAPQAASGNPPWMVTARQEEAKGVREIAGARSNPDIMKYHKSSGFWGADDSGGSNAWCGSFVNWNIERAGINGPKDAFRAKEWASWGNRVEPSKAQVGDVVVIKTGGNNFHVGFFAGRDSSGNVLVLGGNQSDAVNTKSFAASSVYAIRRAEGTPVAAPASTGSAQAAAPVSAPATARTEGRNTVITNADGSTETRSGGTLAWRNNNPGNIRAGDFATRNGAIGTGPGGFAVFPDRATGERAISALLQGQSYRNLSVMGAISRYAPPSENDTKQYQDNIKSWTGLDTTRTIASLSAAELSKVVGAIQRMEGWSAGTVTNSR
jgi:uncharacterized protein (TIGR02594 family)